MCKFFDIILAAAFVGCIIWAAAAPKMQALIPTILAIIIGEILVGRRTNYIKHY